MCLAGSTYLTWKADDFTHYLNNTDFSFILFIVDYHCVFLPDSLTGLWGGRMQFVAQGHSGGFDTVNCQGRPDTLPSSLSHAHRCTHVISRSLPALTDKYPPPSPFPRTLRVGVSEGEAATEAGSGGQLVWTGVQTVRSHRTDLCTWLPTRGWWVRLLSPCLHLFPMSVSLLSSLLSSLSVLHLPFISLSDSTEVCASSPIRPFSP